MASTVAGELSVIMSWLLISARAASIARLTEKATLGVRHKGGSPMHFEPSTPSGFGFLSIKVIRKSIGMSLDVGGLYSQVPFVSNRPVSGSYRTFSNSQNPIPITNAPIINIV